MALNFLASYGLPIKIFSLTVALIIQGFYNTPVRKIFWSILIHTCAEYATVPCNSVDPRVRFISPNEASISDDLPDPTCPITMTSDPIGTSRTIFLKTSEELLSHINDACAMLRAISSWRVLLLRADGMGVKCSARSAVRPVGPSSLAERRKSSMKIYYYMICSMYFYFHTESSPSIGR